MVLDDWTAEELVFGFRCQCCLGPTDSSIPAFGPYGKRRWLSWSDSFGNRQNDAFGSQVKMKKMDPLICGSFSFEGATLTAGTYGISLEYEHGRYLKNWRAEVEAHLSRKSYRFPCCQSSRVFCFFREK